MKKGEHREMWGSKTNTSIGQLVRAEGLESVKKYLVVLNWCVGSIPTLASISKALMDNVLWS
jgi:hypothetical protein